MAITTLINDFHTETTASFARTPAGELFIANGLDRPRKWDGFSASTVVAGLDAPSSAPTVSEAASGGSEEGTYFTAYRFGDAYGNYSSISGVTEVTTTETGKKFDWTTIPIASGTDSSSRVTLRQIFRTLVDDASVFYLVDTIADNTTTTYSTDTLTDDALALREELPVLNDDDSLNARRFGVPPMNKAVVIWNQDRMFYLGDVVYSTGTVSLTSGSGTVTGSGTAFSKSMIGKWLYATGDTRGREITAYSSATGITVSPVAGSNLTGVAYEIRTAPAERNVIYFSETDEPESVPQSQNQFLLQENNSEQDDIVGAFSDSGSLMIGMTTHLYQFNYVRQPHLDGSARMVARRGMYNNRCHAIGDGVHFLMDRFGPYILSGGSIQPIGESVRNYFREGLVDDTYSRYFSVGVNPREQTAKFYIRLTTDSAVKRALVYHYALDRWSEEEYPWGIGGGCELSVNGVPNYFVGKEDDRFCKETYGTSVDGLSASVAGTVSTANQGTNVLVATGSVFAAGHVSVPIVFTSGSGKGIGCVVVTYTNGTTVTVDDIPAGVAAGDTFVIGGIAWSLKTGVMDYPRDGGASNERAIEVVFTPHAVDGNYFDIRHYLNHKSSPETAEMDFISGDESASQAAGGYDGVVNVYRNRNSQYETVGFARKTFTSRHTHYGVSDRWLSVELRGVAMGAPIEINEVAICGAK